MLKIVEFVFLFSVLLRSFLLLLKTFISILNLPSLLSLFLAVRLSGPVEWSVHGGKTDRSSANQIAGLTRKPDRKK